MYPVSVGLMWVGERAAEREHALGASEEDQCRCALEKVDCQTFTTKNHIIFGTVFLRGFQSKEQTQNGILLHNKIFILQELIMDMFPLVRQFRTSTQR